MVSVTVTEMVALFLGDSEIKPSLSQRHTYLISVSRTTEFSVVYHLGCILSFLSNVFK